MIRDKTAAVTRRLEKADRETAAAPLNYLQALLYRDFVNKFYALERDLKPRPGQPPGRAGRAPTEIHRCEPPTGSPSWSVLGAWWSRATAASSAWDFSYHMLASGLVASLVVLTMVLRLITPPAMSAESAGVPISLLGQRR